MTIFNIALFQWALFQTLEKEFINGRGARFRAAPSIGPSTNLFASIVQTNLKSYVKFIQSVYRVDINNDVYFFFFRNARNPDDGSFTWPSSLEVIQVKNNNAATLFKFHYFGNKPDGILKTQTNPYYDDYDVMKQDIKKLTAFFLQEFLRVI